MKRDKKIINWLWVGVIGIYANMMVSLCTDYSLWYFFAIIVGIVILIWLTTNLKKS